jgi:AraC family transcriptional regulator
MSNKENTVKGYHERINKVLIYIQQHYKDDLSLDQLADVANFSVYHFHRIFQAFTNETVYTYVRRLRLQHAAVALIHSKRSVTQIALEIGFETSSSFSKAFKQVFGVTPSTLRKQGALGDYQNPHLKLNDFNEECRMKFEIKTISEQEVLYVRRTGSYFDSAPAAWGAMMIYLREHKIDTSRCEYLGIAYDDPAVVGDDKCRFDACITGLDNLTADGEFGVQTIAGGKYAVFKHVGPYETLGDTYRQAYGQWLPTSGEQLRDAPPFNKYPLRKERDYKTLSDAEKSQLITEIYVPLD